MPRTAHQVSALHLAHTSGLPPLSRALVALAVTFANWETRRLSRRALSRLDGHMLHDIGLSQTARDHEAVKPFWRD